MLRETRVHGIRSDGHPFLSLREREVSAKGSIRFKIRNGQIHAGAPNPAGLSCVVETAYSRDRNLTICRCRHASLSTKRKETPRRGTTAGRIRYARLFIVFIQASSSAATRCTRQRPLYRRERVPGRQQKEQVNSQRKTDRRQNGRSSGSSRFTSGAAGVCAGCCG